MKTTHLAFQFRSAFGYPTHYKAKGEFVSIEPLLVKLKELGIRTGTISYATPHGDGESRVLKLQIAVGTGKKRVGRQVWFNREQEVVHDSSYSLDLSRGQTSTFRGHDPWIDTSDRFE